MIAAYRFVAVTLLSSLLLLFALNGICSVAVRSRDALVRLRSEPERIQYLKPLYPGMSAEQIQELWREMDAGSLRFDPYTQFRERPRHGKYLNLDERGFRPVKDQAPWPPPEDQFNIFVFGGSTTLGWGIPDGETIPSHLQDFFRKGPSGIKVNVYNLGTSGFIATQERIRFEQLLLEGYRPHLAIFIDGINEPFLDEPLFSERLTALFDGRVKSLWAQWPIVRLVKKLVFRAAPQPASEDEKAVAQGKLARYAANKKMIEKISAAYEVNVIFVWQPAPLYQHDLTHDIFFTPQVLKDRQFVYQASVYSAVDDWAKQGKAGDNFLWLGSIQKGLKKPIYVDKVHYSPEFSRYVASLIFNFINDRMNELAGPLETADHGENRD